MIDIYLCEDELSQLNYFTRIIGAFLKENHILAEIVSARNNPLFTINDYIKKEGNTALFFLDVELRGYVMDGFGLARMESIFGKIELLRMKKQNNISISTGSRMMEVNKEDILFIQAVKGSHQIEIYLAYRKLTLRQSLKNISEHLDEKFIFISKSCIVQKKKIREIDKKERKILLEGGYELDVLYREIKKVCSLMRAADEYGLIVQ